jgi:ABC-2 type transport system ATP-binding protein
MAPADPVPAIAVADLTRKYRADVALADVSFTVPGGTITGLLGRNGAGKPVTGL